MNVTFVGSGPGIDAVEAALSDVGVDGAAGDPDDVVDADFAVVSGVTGDEVFAAANSAAREGETPWLAVEVGGVGGVPLTDVDAAVSGFGASTGCFRCLSQRVVANAEEAAVADSPSADRSAVRVAGAVAGREAVALLSGENSSVLGGVVEVPHARREFLPVPHCECDDGRDRDLRQGYKSIDLDEALARAERALDERLGIVGNVGEFESFPAPYYLATNCDTSGFSDATAARKAAGVDADWDGAFMKALGEAIERYAAGVYRESEFEVARPEAVEGAVRPVDLVRGSDDPVDEPIPWVPGEDLATGEAAQLPAEAVQFPPPEERHFRSITTGLGLGSSGVGALLSGLYEVVERDATMLAWYSTFDPLELRVEDERFETLARRARSEGLSVTPLLVTQDVDVPVVSVAVHRDGEWPRFAVGSDADLDPDRAATAALAEAVQNWMELRSMGPEESAEDPSAIARYAEYPPAAEAFVDPGGAVPSERVGPANAPDGEAELDALIDRLGEADLTPYAARLTPRDVAAVDLEAVRVLVPGAQPLFTGDPVFGERARTVPADLGFEPRLDREHHPYP
ncbi:bacteriocin biosynthesis protein SagD [Halostella sp. JP-L12]|uniref:YcaO-like family protein n=1 Tax=Halostella TaxID=1843185 RepID=UPI000EF8313B|nr:MULTISPECIES: YcaO-like family protein [Halostella]NHN48452.1 bacteriocin biosynthesis protein SagD [Halostella sp. JP-L12]